MANNAIGFKPRHGPPVELEYGDQIEFQWSGTDCDGAPVMYNGCAEVAGDPLHIEFNGKRYAPLTFLFCDFLDGDIAIDHLRVVGKWNHEISGETAG